MRLDPCDDIATRAFSGLTKAPTGTTEALITQQKCCISGFRVDCSWMAAKAEQMVRYPVTLTPDDNPPPDEPEEGRWRKC